VLVKDKLKGNMMSKNVNDYVTLGRSGLRVSPLCLGTMTFGTEWGWGSEEKVAREVFDRYVDAGGNFLDTADAYEKSPAQVALNWAATQPGVTSIIIGASKPAQFEDNLRLVEFEIPGELRNRLDQASAIEPGHPYVFFGPQMQGWISGGTNLLPWQPAGVYAPPSQETASAKTSAAGK
jgi:diketogulonate reductase-like aldo/keto reductase